MYKIEKNIEKPASCNEGMYPFSTMEVGDSFFAPLNRRMPNQLQNSILGSARLSRFADKKFTTRIIKSEKMETIGIRCWRIK